MEYTKLFDGVYRVSPSLEPFLIKDEYYPDDYLGKISHIQDQIREFMDRENFQNAYPTGWGPTTSKQDNTGSATYHIDGLFKSVPEKYDYMFLCALSNNLKHGTYLKITCNNGKMIRILTKPWTPYLIRGDIPHRGKPINFDIRACIRWYFHSNGKLS